MSLSDNYTHRDFHTRQLLNYQQTRQLNICSERNQGKEFETVYIPENKRNTVCVSTQSGCRMGCRFCATAQVWISVATSQQVKL